MVFMNSLLKEFREFILKGNMLDMAVGIVIGAAFTTVVKSLVDNIVMPPIGLLLGGMDFSNIAWTIRKPVVEDGIVVKEAVTMNTGAFINDIIALVIVGFCVFMLVKTYNQAKKRFEKEKANPDSPAEPSNEEKLLTEIRDLLANK